MRTELVRKGCDYRIPKNGHSFLPVYKEMLLQVTSEYNGLPDVRSLKAGEIRFFYNGMRANLKNVTKDTGKK